MKLKSIASRTTIHDGGLTFLSDLALVAGRMAQAPALIPEPVMRAAAASERAAPAKSFLKAQTALADTAAAAGSDDQPTVELAQPVSDSDLSAAALLPGTRLDPILDLPTSAFDDDLLATGSTPSLHQWEPALVETVRLETVALSHFDQVKSLDPTDMGPPLDVRGMTRDLGGPHGSPFGLTHDRWDIDI